MEYPSILHRSHNDYPLAPQRLSINETMLSTFQQQFPSQQKKTSTKLAPNLYDKFNYVVHYRNLKFYLQQGLVIKKIHRVLSFKQSAWLKNYIDFNTGMRSKATSDFEKDFFKLMNNSVFGKTQENLRNRVNVEVVTNREIAMKRVCKPTFKRSYTIHEDLTVMQTAVTNLELNKPIYVGFSVLDLSKLLMYEFHYQKMLPQYPNRLNLCFTDTDSFLYEVYTENIYHDMLKNKNDFDFSEYPFDHPNYSTVNKKVIGKFKDELNSLTLEEFIGLRPKCYSLLFRGEVKKNIVQHMDDAEKQTAKGTKSSVKKNHLRHHHYRDVLENLSMVRVKQNVIKSRHHNIGTYHQNKVALTAYDTKRWICGNGVNTLAYGHFATSIENNINWDDDIEVL